MADTYGLETLETISTLLVDEWEQVREATGCRISEPCIASLRYCRGALVYRMKAGRYPRRKRRRA